MRSERPPAWHGRDRFVALVAGDDAAADALGLWQAWADDGDGRCARLHLIAVQPTLPQAAALRAAHAGTALEGRALRLADALPPATPNLHRLAFDDGRVQWLFAPGPLAPTLRALQARVDAVWMDARDLPVDADTMGIAKSLARLAQPGARLFLRSASSAVGAALARQGFAVPDADALGGRPAATFRPHPTGRRAAEAVPAVADRRALIVGAGLAGCAAAWALAEQGWTSTIVDRRSTPAAEASSNPAGMFHGTVNAADGPHARFNRAAALEAQRAVRTAIEQFGVHGKVGGLLRLHGDSPAAMRAQLDRQRLPPDYAAALDATQASRLCGLPLAQAAWHFPGGGWVDPAGYARSLLARAGPAAFFRGEVPIARLHRGVAGWAALDDRGHILAEAPVVVLANGVDAARLLGDATLPLRTIRGQLTVWPAAESDPRLQLPRLPLAGSGYLLPPVDGAGIFGATAQADDPDPGLRSADHAYNLARLQRLSRGTLPHGVPEPAAIDGLQGRVGWRCLVRDRLPLIGPALAAEASARPAETTLARLPREPGLHVFAGLGSRGITWAALGAQLLAARISGAPWPLERALADATDPARFAQRSRRRA